MTSQVAFHELPAEQFPITIQFIGRRSRQVHHLVNIAKPDGLAAHRIPSLTHIAEPVDTVVWTSVGPPVIVFANGDVDLATNTPIYDDLIDQMRAATRDS